MGPAAELAATDEVGACVVEGASLVGATEETGVELGAAAGVELGTTEDTDGTSDVAGADEAGAEDSTAEEAASLEAGGRPQLPEWCLRPDQSHSPDEAVASAATEVASATEAA